MAHIIKSALDEKAQAALERQERIVLSERDFARFIESIENPELPTQELWEAMTEHQRLKVMYPESGL